MKIKTRKDLTISIIQRLYFANMPHDGRVVGQRYCSNKRRAHLLGPIVPREINCRNSISLVMSGLASSTATGGYNACAWLRGSSGIRRTLVRRGALFSPFIQLMAVFVGRTRRDLTVRDKIKRSCGWKRLVAESRQRTTEAACHRASLPTIRSFSLSCRPLAHFLHPRNCLSGYCTS